jgi:hypothetical protein
VFEILCLFALRILMVSYYILVGKCHFPGICDGGLRLFVCLVVCSVLCGLVYVLFYVYTYNYFYVLMFLCIAIRGSYSYL